jgi:Ca2+-transporting ATPase
MVENWYSSKRRTLMDDLNVDEDIGLSSDEAELRIVQYGLNELDKGEKKSPFMLFIEQFRDPLIFILLAALIISVIIGLFSHDEQEKVEYFIDAAAISVIVLFNAFLVLFRNIEQKNQLKH